MDKEQQDYLLQLARRSIREKLAGGRIAAPEPPAWDAMRQHCGAFVTLKTQGRLRGCIGNISSTEPLYRTIGEMAVAAATHDPRFPPMAPDELDGAHIEISVLTPLEKVDRPEEIHVGVHGLLIRKGRMSGLLLPQVPVEWNWDRETFLEHTCRKAGLPPNAWKEPDTEIFRFSADVFGEE